MYKSDMKFSEVSKNSSVILHQAKKKKNNNNVMKTGIYGCWINEETKPDKLLDLNLNIKFKKVNFVFT